MSDNRESTIRVRIELTNPGQFFACCGLFELADRIWNGVEGWFDRDSHFCLRPTRPASNWGAATLLGGLTECVLTNAMTSSQVKRREELSAMSKKAREADPALQVEKKHLDGLYREEPVILGEPFNLTLDWFRDKYAGGKDLKTWAGQQSVVDIAGDMRRLINHDAHSEDWLFHSSSGDAVPFNFDSDLGNTGSDLDLGFSVDPLKQTGLKTQTRPLLELVAFIGLQRFRPCRIHSDSVYRFSVWYEPLLPEVAAAVTNGSVDCLRSRGFRFRLLYRTKYLKSFLPATPT
jgi:CRISPR-associated protein Csb3